MNYPYQDFLIDKDRLFILQARGVGTTTLILNKIKETPNADRRICILTTNTNYYYFAIRKQFEDSVIEYKSQSAMKIGSNWIHIITPKDWLSIRGSILTDIYVSDYDEYGNEHKEALMNLIALQSPKTLWLTGTQLNDVHIRTFIKTGHKNYILGNDKAMPFYAVLNKENTIEQVIDDSINELHKRI